MNENDKQIAQNYAKQIEERIQVTLGCRDLLAQYILAAITEANQQHNEELKQAKELLREIRDGEVNAEDEADKFLRDHVPSELSVLRQKLTQQNEDMARLNTGIDRLFALVDAKHYDMALRALDAARGVQPAAKEYEAAECLDDTAR